MDERLGHLIGGKPLSRGALYLMLQNRLYRGEIVHKGQSYPGEHTPIVDQPLWDSVQAQFAGNAAERNSGTHPRQPSLLAGMLFDGDGDPMTPTHAIKKGRRYRYYVSRPLIINDQTEPSAGLRVPALEQALVHRARQRDAQLLDANLGLPQSSSDVSGRATHLVQDQDLVAKLGGVRVHVELGGVRVQQPSDHGVHLPAIDPEARAAADDQDVGLVGAASL